MKLVLSKLPGSTSRVITMLSSLEMVPQRRHLPLPALPALLHHLLQHPLSSSTAMTPTTHLITPNSSLNGTWAKSLTSKTSSKQKNKRKRNDNKTKKNKKSMGYPPQSDGPPSPTTPPVRIPPPHGIRSHWMELSLSPTLCRIWTWTLNLPAKGWQTLTPASHYLTTGGSLPIYLRTMSSSLLLVAATSPLQTLKATTMTMMMILVGTVIPPRSQWLLTLQPLIKPMA